MRLCVAFLALFCSSAFALDTGDIVIASTSGEVHFLVKGSERTLRAGSVLELPANIRTGRDGAVELRQGATSISVGPETLLEFPALEKAGGPIDRVVQPSGNAFYNIGKRPGRKLRVETPFLVGVVKGTQFNVAALENSTTISLFEGLLEIRAADDTDVVDLHAGEIARRDRGGSDISVLKMDGRLSPEAKPPKSPAGGNNNTPAPAPQPAAPAPGPANVEGEARFVEHDAGLRAVAAPESVAEANAPAGVSIGSEAPAADMLPGTPASAAPVVDVAVVAPDMGSPANLDIAVAGSPGNGASVDVGVSTPGNAANVDLGVSPPGNGANVDVSVSTPANAGNVDVAISTPGNGANVDVTVGTPVADVGTNVDLGGGSPVSGGPDVSVDTPAGNADVIVNVDNTASPGADVSVAVETPLAGGAANVDVSVETPGADVSLNVGGVSVDVGANVDLTSTPAADVGAGVDLGLGNDAGAIVTPVTETVTTVVEDTHSLLEGLLKKPGRK